MGKRGGSSIRCGTEIIEIGISVEGRELLGRDLGRRSKRSQYSVFVFCVNNNDNNNNRKREVVCDRLSSLSKIDRTIEDQGRSRLEQD